MSKLIKNFSKYVDYHVFVICDLLCTRSHQRQSLSESLPFHLWIF